MMRRAFTQIAKFCTNVTKQQPTSLTQAEKAFSQTPVYLRPYDKTKYEVPMKKIKRNSGYAVMEIEPFPRARIMRICYNILEQIKIDIPQTSIVRIYLQQQTKYIMEVTDKTQDVQQLQELLADQTIQHFILSLGRKLKLIKDLRQQRLWEDLEKQDSQQNANMEIAKLTGRYQSKKFPIYKKGERPATKFIDV